MDLLLGKGLRSFYSEKIRGPELRIQFCGNKYYIKLLYPFTSYSFDFWKYFSLRMYKKDAVSLL